VGVSRAWIRKHDFLVADRYAVIFPIELLCGQDQRPLLLDAFIQLPAYFFSTTRSAKRSARAAMVKLGLVPTGPGITDPSAI
jgi:hypothetical protein